MENCIRLSKLAQRFGVDENVAYQVFMQYGLSEGQYLMGMDSNSAMVVPQYVVDELDDTDRYLSGLIYSEDDIFARATTDIPDDWKPRVYFLLDGHRIVYIGQSKNFKARVQTHFRDKVFKSVSAFSG